MRSALLLLLPVMLAACNSSSQPVPTQSLPATLTATPQLRIPDNLRNVRYCEVILVAQKGLELNAQVYNTLGLNDCPENLWSQLNVDAIAKQYGVKLAKLNGPRYWVINRLDAGGATVSGKTANFGGIEMELRATLDTKLMEGSVGDKLYSPNQVKRNTVWTYLPGNRVYELIAPEGDVYVMQSYSQIVDPKLTLAELDNLGSRLKLPQGWKYQTKTLSEKLELKADGLAYVINDDFYNSYQRQNK